MPRITTLLQLILIASAAGSPVCAADGAFYAPQWSGKITLRGLSQQAYRVTDYVEGNDLGTVRGPAATLDVQFEKYLLLEAKPE